MKNNYDSKPSRTAYQVNSQLNRFAQIFNKVNQLTFEWNAFIETANTRNFFKFRGAELNVKLPSFDTCNYEMVTAVLPKSLIQYRNQMESALKIDAINNILGVTTFNNSKLVRPRTSSDLDADVVKTRKRQKTGP